MDKLYSPAKMAQLRAKHDFRHSKSLGQNFLSDKNIIDAIIEGSEIGAEDLVIEIGPGMGVLTAAAAECASRVVAVEIDRHLIPILTETLENYDNVEIINADVMKTDLSEVVEKYRTLGKVRIIGNLPYYITTPIVMKLLEEKLPVDSLTVMVQKEAAVRICAAPGTRAFGAVSVAVQYYSQPQILFDVPRDCFFPAPNVDSAVIRLNIRKEPPVKLETEEKQFFKLVKAAFGQRRKTVLNSLNTGLGKSKEELSAALQQAGIAPTARAEKLTMEQFGTLCNLLFPNKTK